MGKKHALVIMLGMGVMGESVKLHLASLASPLLNNLLDKMNIWDRHAG